MEILTRMCFRKSTSSSDTLVMVAVTVTVPGAEARLKLCESRVEMLIA